MPHFRILPAAIAAAALLTGCAGKSKPAPRARVVMPVTRDIPNVLKGTVGSVATFQGIDATLITGYGLVVGLHGTGGGTLPEAVAGHMERMMALKGVGRSARGLGPAMESVDGLGRTPAELLRDPNVAVVVVYARIPPGAPEGMPFDAFVQAINASSLEGGRLWTTDLQIGASEPFGGFQKQPIALARGSIFVNPFGEPGVDGGMVNLAVGRVLHGGVVTQPLKINIQLDEPSHNRARLIASAINTRFPQGPDDREPVARGRNDSGITITIPARYRLNPGDFVKVIQHLPFDLSIPAEEYARRYTEAMVAEPGLAEELSWSLRALGEAALPAVRKLYDYPELTPRIAALRVGAFLGDSRAADPLLEMARTGTPIWRMEAIRLLKNIEAGFRVDDALLGLLDDPDKAISIAAYETLGARAEHVQRRRILAEQPTFLQSSGQALTSVDVENMSRMWLPGDTIQGITRMPIEGRFLLDQVDSARPRIYVTQQGVPKIVVFGEAALKKPLFVSVWSDRLILAADTADDPVRLMYRSPRTGRALTCEVPENIAALVELLGHTPTIEDARPGLAMSYAEVVAALHAIAQAGATDAEFTTEQDKLLLELLEATRGMTVEERPERPGEKAAPLPIPALPDAENPEPEEFQPKVVPLTPPNVGAG